MRKFEVISFQAQGPRENKLEKSAGLGINYHLPKKFLINQSKIFSDQTTTWIKDSLKACEL